MKNQFLKITQLFTLLLLGFGIISCDVQEIEDPLAESEQLSFLATSILDADGETDPNLRVAANLIYDENFEGSNPLSFTWKQLAESYSFGTVTNPAFQGSKAGKFELRYGDKVVTNSGVRAEVLFPAQNNRERWYSFAVNFPADGFQKDNDTEIISQWHQETLGSPSASLNVKNDRLILIVGNVQNVGSSKKDNIDLGPVPKNSWNEFVFHYVHSNGSDGLIEVWQNGKKILTRKGGNIYPGALPKWKIGVYKWTWASKKTDVSKRVLYYDNVRMGNENATFNDMSSSGTTATAPAPTSPTSTTPTNTTSTSPISSFTLIAANLNRDLQVISEGNSISTNTHKLNIRANMESGFKGTVKFSLSGTRSHTYTDNSAPFSMFGDDGKSNYYFGPGLSKGTYTLVATPSTGASKTIKFTIK
ncbi:polysaccharide lyase [Rhodonellum sp.]|uniref:polysaccharide lyase n=1 Tax=Rhodonellum sp. TaxID=2231180 RepID=UPI002720284D|nr:polysaccharide lyase [Rhodonellum sp.]MDO9552898.1 polysaccharide lyase [Rhodonellum sp.]